MYLQSILMLALIRLHSECGGSVLMNGACLLDNCAKSGSLQGCKVIQTIINQPIAVTCVIIIAGKKCAKLDPNVSFYLSKILKCKST
uniref:Uncharacterized protein n=1 Tax=Pyxicephalus adspersus TaxID=30357 RepID=A0AAV3B2T4_PYXAD|nr:TPA: hypothetical protein GDO54_001967 [Pyxicephalus adspersus]